MIFLNGEAGTKCTVQMDSILEWAHAGSAAADRQSDQISDGLSDNLISWTNVPPCVARNPTYRELSGVFQHNKVSNNIEV